MRMPMARIATIAALLAAAATAAAAGPKAPELALESYRLDNGLRVALHRDPSVPRVTVCVAYHVGAKDERAGRTGFAHFFEHMMFRGTKNVPNYDIPLQEAGAQSNAFTTEDMTVYYETVPSDFLERALYLEAERLAFLPSSLNQEKFDTERQVVKNERRQSYENVPYGMAEETLLAAVFPKGEAYSWSVIGSMKDLDAATLDDLRRFFAEYYHPGNATLVLAGDFDATQAKELISKYFGPLVAGPARRKVEPPGREAKSAELKRTDRVQLPRLYLAWPTVADGHPDAPALDLLATVLAGGDASRLHRALVLEKRLATDASASSDTKEIGGLLTIEATADEGKSIEEIGRVIDAELARARAEAPSKGELDRALAVYERALYASLTPPLGRAVTFATGFAQHDDPSYYRRDFARYVKVTPDDVRRVAREYLVKDRVSLVIGPVPPGGEPSPTTVQAGPAAVADSSGPAPGTRTPKGGPDWSKLPGPGAPRPLHAPKYVRKTLSNGLDVWVCPWRTLPVVSSSLIVPAGTADDSPDKSGLAQLTATLLDQGTKDKTATELAEAFEALGTSPRVNAGVDHTTVGLSVIARNFDPALALLAPMLTGPRFDPKDFERERQLQLAELLQGPEDPSWIALRAFRALLFGKGTPYGLPPDGTPATVKALKLDDVRAFHRDHFGPDGATFIVVGDIEPDAVFRSLEKTLGTWKKGDRKPAAAPPRPAAGAGASAAIFLADKPGAVQSVVRVGRRWVDRADPRYFATLIGNRVLGADFLSRLNQNLREEHGYTYGAGSVFDYRRVGSVWLVSTSVRTDATAPALKEILKELDDLAAARPFTAEEIEVARAAEARSYPETFESPSGIAGILAEMALFRLPADYLDTFLDRLRAATPDSIRAAMTDLVSPDARTVLVVGDRKSISKDLQALKRGPVRPVTPDGQPVR